MYEVQVADCEGTKLTTAVSGIQIEHFGTVRARLLELKTGAAPTGGRHRILTFIVTGPLGTQTFTRVADGVRDDVTGELYRGDALERTVPCGFCGGDTKLPKLTRTVTTKGVLQLCEECVETIDATA